MLNAWVPDAWPRGTARPRDSAAPIVSDSSQTARHRTRERKEGPRPACADLPERNQLEDFDGSCLGAE